MDIYEPVNSINIKGLKMIGAYDQIDDFDISQ